MENKSIMNENSKTSMINGNAVAILNSAEHDWVKHVQQLMNTNNANGINIIEYFLYRFSTEDIIYADIIEYVIRYIMDIEQFKIAFNYLTFMKFDNDMIIILIANIVRALFCHGGIIFKTTVIGNKVEITTNWNDLTITSTLIDNIQSILRHELLKDGNVRIFCPYLMPCTKTPNMFNGYFSKHIPRYIRLQEVDEAFSIGTKESVRPSVVIRPSKDYLGTTLRLMLKGGEQDNEFKAFVEAQAIAEVDANLNKQKENQLCDVNVSNNITGKGYEKKLLSQIKEINDEFKKETELHLQKQTILYDSDHGLLKVNQNNYNTIVTPVSVEAKYLNAPSTGKDNYFHTEAVFRNNLINKFNLNVAPQNFIQEIQHGIENILTTLFTYYIVPSSFKELIMVAIEKELQLLEKFYISEYMLYSPEEFRNGNHYSLLQVEYSQSKFKNIEGFFHFNLVYHIDNLNLKEKIDNMREVYVKLIKYYEAMILKFDTELHPESYENATTQIDKFNPITIQWGKKEVQPFNTSKIESGKSESRKKRTRENDDEPKTMD